jgi:hypothetical protein
VINLFGGPGSGKTNTCSALHSALKSEGKSIEQSLEHPKELMYDDRYKNRRPSLYEEVWFFGEQCRRLTIYLGNVDLVVTDKPLLMNAWYASKTDSALGAVMLSMWQCVAKQLAGDGHKQINLYLERIAPYQQEGRYQSEEEARATDPEIRAFLIDIGAQVYLSDEKHAVNLIKSLLMESSAKV